MKYILVTGGVISGVGKGIISSCLGTILQGLGCVCTAIKIDPYINIDAGTFSPFEHGEVFVLDDGSEVDLDLGNYERFLNVRLTTRNNITTGKIFQKVITSERKGEYLGKTVQYVPHITDAIREWIKSVACEELKSDDGKAESPEFCVIELGGTVGDIESQAYIEALRKLQFEAGLSNFFHAHVSLIVEPRATGDQKTKPAQRGVRDLFYYGLNPDLIIARSSKVLAPEVRSKLADSCGLLDDQVISVHDMPLYEIPQYLVDQNLLEILKKKLNIHLNQHISVVLKWNKLAEATKNSHLEVKIALVGKYVKFLDAYASVIKALSHAALSYGAKLNMIYIESSHLEAEQSTSNINNYNASWNDLKKADGIIVPGGFDIRGIEGKIVAINYARLNKIPCLGICLGFQCAVIEFARHQLNLPDANSTEFSTKTTNPVIIDMPEHNQGTMGGTMRLGLKTTVFTDSPSTVKQLYGNKETIEERHRHRYEVNPEFIDLFENAGLRFVGKDKEKIRMEIYELADHPYFVGVQFHPEFLSRPITPSPPFVGLIATSIKLPLDYHHLPLISTHLQR